jgi:hypothetical protein
MKAREKCRLKPEELRVSCGSPTLEHAMMMRLNLRDKMAAGVDRGKGWDYQGAW